MIVEVVTVLLDVTDPSDKEGITRLVRTECADERRECPVGRTSSGASITADSERSCVGCTGI